MIVHVVKRSAWLEARTAGTYRAESLDSEGFIHFSSWLYAELPVGAVVEVMPLEGALERAAG